MRKIIQILTVYDDDGSPSIVSLCDDGSVWEMQSSENLEWTRLPDIPKDPQEELDDGWIDWKGGMCPVDADTRVKIKHRDGMMSRNFAKAICFRWDHIGNISDIVAYKVLK